MNSMDDHLSIFMVIWVYGLCCVFSRREGRRNDCLLESSSSSLSSSLALAFVRDGNTMNNLKKLFHREIEIGRVWESFRPVVFWF